MNSTRRFEPSTTIPLASALNQKPLPFGRKVGHIKVGANRPVGNPARYFATCDCGNKDFYLLEELKEIISRWGGCGKPDCTALNFKDTVWTSPDSLRMQLHVLLMLAPEEVESWWGGTMDDVHELDRDAGYRNLEEYLLEKGQVGVWLGRKDSYLPFMESNVFLGNKPDKLLLNFDKGKIEVEGEMMTMKELCQFSKLDADQLLLMIYELGTTDDLLFNLLEK
jgi:hypothetical protein